MVPGLSLARGDFSTSVQTGPGAYPAYDKMNNGRFLLTSQYLSIILLSSSTFCRISQSAWWFKFRKEQLPLSYWWTRVSVRQSGIRHRGHLGRYSSTAGLALPLWLRYTTHTDVILCGKTSYFQQLTARRDCTVCYLTYYWHYYDHINKPTPPHIPCTATTIVHLMVFGWWNFQTVAQERVTNVATASWLV
jgi:hypothetical protein